MPPVMQIRVLAEVPKASFIPPAPSLPGPAGISLRGFHVEQPLRGRSMRP
jgi:hypothetical protein